MPVFVSKDVVNCSVPWYDELKALFSCNMKEECEQGQDELDCSYHSKECGPDSYDAGSKCWRVVENIPDWQAGHTTCRSRGERLATLQHASDLDLLATLTNKHRSRLILIGLSPMFTILKSLSPYRIRMYSKMLFLDDGQAAFYVSPDYKYPFMSTFWPECHAVEYRNIHQISCQSGSHWFQKRLNALCEREKQSNIIKYNPIKLRKLDRSIESKNHSGKILQQVFTKTATECCKKNEELVLKNNTETNKLIDKSKEAIDKNLENDVTLGLVQCNGGYFLNSVFACSSKSRCLNERKWIIDKCEMSDSKEVTKLYDKRTDKVNIRSHIVGRDSTTKNYVLMYECSTLKDFIHYSLVCDHHAHCPDQSDEDFCRHPNCPITAFHCSTGECIPLSRYLDNKSDCWDISDEQFTSAQFKGSGSKKEIEKVFSTH